MNIYINFADPQGNTALDMVLERLTSKAESGQSYDLEEEHTAIRELLSREMRKLGYEPPPQPSRTACSHHSNEERTAASARGKRSDDRKQVRQKQPPKQVLLILLVLYMYTVHVFLKTKWIPHGR
jgi:hypothetical protein